MTQCQAATGNAGGAGSPSGLPVEVPFRRHVTARATLVRVLRTCLLMLFVSSGGLMTIGCRSSQEVNSNSESAAPEITTSRTPPFPTHEPERYQAIRIITFKNSSANPAYSSTSQTRTSSVVIARHGDKRREEYQARLGKQIIYLEIPAGRFALLPARKLYADLSAAANEINLSDLPDESGVSTDLLLQAEPAAAKYEKLGTEIVEGRTTTKYRVIIPKRTDATAVSGETLIWVDEALGMPVRSETMSSAGAQTSNVTMELKDIKLEVDEQLFALPVDYRKVEAQLIFDLIRKGEKLAGPKQEEK